LESAKLVVSLILMLWYYFPDQCLLFLYQKFKATFVVLQIQIEATALLSIEIQCYGQEKPHFINCNTNGQWNSNLYDFCKSEYI